MPGRSDHMALLGRTALLGSRVRTGSLGRMERPALTEHRAPMGRTGRMGLAGALLMGLLARRTVRPVRPTGM